MSAGLGIPRDSQRWAGGSDPLTKSQIEALLALFQVTRETETSRGADLPSVQSLTNTAEQVAAWV